MTNDEKAAYLATEVMGWCDSLVAHECADTLSEHFWVNGKGKRQWRVDAWRPHTDRNQLAMAQEKLTEGQLSAYVLRLAERLPGCSIMVVRGEAKWAGGTLEAIRTADPAVCVDAIIEALKEAT